MSKADKALKEAAQVHGPECLNILWSIAQSGETEQARIAAAKELLDRGYGKPRQSVEVSGEGGGAIEIENRVSELDDTRLERLIAATATATDDSHVAH